MPSTLCSLTRGPAALLLAAVLLAGRCGSGAEDPDATANRDGAADATDPGSDALPAGDAHAPDGGDAGPPPCPQGIICVSSLPYHDENDTSASASRQLDGYGCAPGVDESGPEVIYRVIVPEAGFLSAAVPDDVPGVDVDLHLLASLDAADCLDRGNVHVGAHVPPGIYYVVADTWVDGGGTELPGPYALDIGLLVPTPGDCAVTTDVVERLWGPAVTLPAVGPVVLEAHLVTEPDPFAPGEWPTSITDRVDEHWAISFAETGLVMTRDQPWCPQESSEFGQSAYGAPLPLVDEGWYVNMLWASRPPPGTRMIVRLPGGGPAVVAAAGYETGPGDTSNLGGVTEEIHFYLGTGHLDELEFGFAEDQTLPLGPIACQ